MKSEVAIESLIMNCGMLYAGLQRNTLRLTFDTSRIESMADVAGKGNVNSTSLPLEKIVKCRHIRLSLDVDQKYNPNKIT